MSLQLGFGKCVNYLKLKRKKFSQASFSRASLTPKAKCHWPEVHSIQIQLDFIAPVNHITQSSGTSTEWTRPPKTWIPVPPVPWGGQIIVMQTCVVSLSSTGYKKPSPLRKNKYIAHSISCSLNFQIGEITGARKKHTQIDTPSP